MLGRMSDPLCAFEVSMEHVRTAEPRISSEVWNEWMAGKPLLSPWLDKAGIPDSTGLV